MSYKLISDMVVKDQLEQICLVDKIESKTTQTNKPFTRVTIKDISGSMIVNIWDTHISYILDLKPGSYAVFKLNVQIFRGSKVATATPPMLVRQPEDISQYV